MVIDFFLKWVRTARVSERAAAAAALARAYCQGEISFEDRCAAEAALTFLLDDPSARVRAALADALSMSPGAPFHIVAALAGDQPVVAAPIIARSPLLSDVDLIDRFAAALPPTQRLIAGRASVSMPLCAAIAELGDEDACLSLVRNDGADIAAVSFRRIVERHGDRPALREALAAHPKLPSDCRHVLLAALADAFRHAPLLTAVMGTERAARTVREACQKSALTLIEATPAAEHGALVEHMRLRGDLTSAFLVRAVAHGRIDFFGTVLTALTGRRMERIRAALAAGADGALSALFRHAGLAQPIHAVILRALKVWREVALARRSAGTQEVSFLMLQELGGPSATGELATLLRSIHLDASRANARRHALELQAA